MDALNNPSLIAETEDFILCFTPKNILVIISNQTRWCRPSQALQSVVQCVYVHTNILLLSHTVCSCLSHLQYQWSIVSFFGHIFPFLHLKPFFKSPTGHLKVFSAASIAELFQEHSHPTSHCCAPAPKLFLWSMVTLTATRHNHIN